MRAFIDAQQQLIGTLSHHLIHVAEQLHLLADNVARERLIEGARSRWDRKATFEWTIEAIPATNRSTLDYQYSITRLDPSSEQLNFGHVSAIVGTEVILHLGLPTTDQVSSLSLLERLTYGTYR